MTLTHSNRFVAALFAGAFVLAVWLPTVTVPADHSQFATAPAAVELA